MSKKIEISKEILEKIIKFYILENHSKKETIKKFNISGTKLKNTLAENGFKKTSKYSKNPKKKAKGKYKNRLKCLECEKEDIINLYQHIKLLHRMTKEEYIEKYSYGGNFVATPDKNLKEKMGKKREDFKVWNKGLTVKDDPRIKSNAGRKMTKEQKEYISKKTKEAMKRPEIRKKLQVPSRGLNFHTERPEVRDKISTAVRKNWKDDKYATKCANNQFGTKTEYNGIIFRSKAEAKFAKYMDEHNIKYEYEKYLFEYELNGVLHNYRPDFYLPKYDTFLEVKYKINKEDDKVFIKLNAVKEQNKRILLVDLSMLNKLVYIL